jgi:hypothetical protein
LSETATSPTPSESLAELFELFELSELSFVVEFSAADAESSPLASVLTVAVCESVTVSAVFVGFANALPVVKPRIIARLADIIVNFIFIELNSLIDYLVHMLRQAPQVKHSQVLPSAAPRKTRINYEIHPASPSLN